MICEGENIDVYLLVVAILFDSSKVSAGVFDMGCKQLEISIFIKDF